MISAAAVLEEVPITRPISDLRTNLNEICEQAESGAPVFLTKNGTAKLVVFDCDAYEEMLQYYRAEEKILEAEMEAKYNPKTYTLEEIDTEVNELFDYLGV